MGPGSNVRIHNILEFHDFDFNSEMRVAVFCDEGVNPPPPKKKKKKNKKNKKKNTHTHNPHSPTPITQYEGAATDDGCAADIMA